MSLDTGSEAQKTPEPENPPRWYARILRGIQLGHGGGIGVDSDQHPDPSAEACRWQICEGGLVQALGRARGVNRTAETPLDVDILADVVLPVTINEVIEWSAVPTGAAIEMMADARAIGSRRVTLGHLDMQRRPPARWRPTRSRP